MPAPTESCHLHYALASRTEEAGAPLRYQSRTGFRRFFESRRMLFSPPEELSEPPDTIRASQASSITL